MVPLLHPCLFNRYASFLTASCNRCDVVQIVPTWLGVIIYLHIMTLIVRVVRAQSSHRLCHIMIKTNKIKAPRLLHRNSKEILFLGPKPTPNRSSANVEELFSHENNLVICSFFVASPKVRVWKFLLSFHWEFRAAQVWYPIGIGDRKWYNTFVCVDLSVPKLSK